MAGKSPLQAHGAIIAGVVKLDNPIPYKAALKAWDGRIILTIEEEPTSPSAKQRRFYWKFLTEWARVSETGYSKEELHDALKQRHNGKLMTFEGHEIMVGQTTTKLSVQEFTAFIDRCMADAANIDGFYMEPTQSEDWRVTSEAGK